MGSLLATLINLVGVLLAPGLALATVLVETMFHLLVFDYPQHTATVRIDWATAKHNGPHWLQQAPAEPNSLGPLAKIAIVVPYQAVISGCFMATLAALRGVVFHPLVGMVQLILTTTLQGLRLTRDALTWNLVIRHAAKVPATDSFLAKRVHGPGLASTYYYRIPLEAAKTSAQLFLDMSRIRAYADLQRAEIKEPFNRYNSMFDTALKPFGIQGVCTEDGPNHVAGKLIRNWKARNPRLEPLMYSGTDSADGDSTTPTDIWDSLAQKIRAANPDHIKLQAQHSRDLSEKRDVLTYPSQMDKKIIDSLGEHPITNREGSVQYKLMASRAGHLLAELFLQQDYRGECRSISLFTSNSTTRVRSQ